jgi:uncharacterized protein (DUF924 family)
MAEIVSLDSAKRAGEPVSTGGKHMNTRNFVFAVALSAAVASADEQFANPFYTSTPMSASAALSSLKPDSKAVEVITFWREAGPALWFAKDAAFDEKFRNRFILDHEAAARGELVHWQSTPEGALALLILLDQFPRNAFRDTPRMYATDSMARKIAMTALSMGFDQKFPQELQKFFILPFAHSEDLADQERAVAFARRMSADDLAHAEHHRDIVKRFGRFPHRNRILGRTSTAEEQQYLDDGGYAG